MQRLSASFIHILNRKLTRNYPTRQISLHPTIQLYSTSISLPTSDDSFANYLVSSLGFSYQQAQSASNKFSKYRSVNSFNFEANAVSVVGFFKSHGFEDTHLRKIVSFNPQFLCSNVDKRFKPKLQLLRDEGFSESDIIEVVYGNPRLLESGVESSIVPALQALRNVMGCDTLVIGVLKKLVFHIKLTINLMPNVELLTSYGIPIEVIRNHILSLPSAFMRKPEIFNDMVSMVKNKWGICPDSPMFLYGIRLACGSSEANIESKCRVFKSFGWNQSDVQTLMMKNPPYFAHSEAAIKKKLNFLMNELRLEPDNLTSKSAFFSCSLEKRIVPRHKILLFLKENGLVEKEPSFYTAICMSESRFLNMFVRPFKEVHKVYVELTGCSMKLLTREISETCS